MPSDISSTVITNLHQVRQIQDLVCDTPTHHAEPNSDLAGDEIRFPDIWAVSLVRRGIVHAVENIDAACTLVLTGEGWTAPQFALLRAAYESSAAAIWLLESDDVDTRLARLIWQHRESWRYSSTAHTGTPLDDQGEHAQRLQWATDAARRLSINPAAGKSGGFENLIKTVDDLPVHPESLLTAWRICSGVSHAKTWALNTVTIEVDNKPLYEHGRLSAREPNTDLFATFLGVARRGVQRAWNLYRIRTTTRPHSLTSRLELRDAQGNLVPETGRS